MRYSRKLRYVFDTVASDGFEERLDTGHDMPKPTILCRLRRPVKHKTVMAKRGTELPVPVDLLREPPKLPEPILNHACPWSWLPVD